MSFIVGDYEYEYNDLWLDESDIMVEQSVPTGSYTTTNSPIVWASIYVEADVPWRQDYYGEIKFYPGSSQSYTENGITASYNGSNTLNINITNSAAFGDYGRVWVVFQFALPQSNEVSAKVVDTTKSSYTNLSYTFTYNGATHTVTSMDSCYKDCTNLTTTPIIPSGVLNLYSCFKNCKKITTAPTIPNSVESMGSCFENCEKLTTMPTIPSGNITSLDSTFYGCKALTATSVIPSNITSLRNCFYGCTSLTQIEPLPQSITNMYSCFYNCTALVDPPIIPSAVDNMHYCFYGCTNLNGDLIVYNTPTYRTSLFTRTSKTIIVFCGSEDATHHNTWKTIANSYSNVISNGIYNDDYFLTVLNASEHTLKARVIDTTKTSYTKLFSDISGVNSWWSLKSINACFKNCTNLVTSPTIPSDITDVTDCFNGCTSLEGSVVISANNSEQLDSYSNIFLNTTKNIYIICISAYSTALNMWKTIANSYSNVSVPIDNLDYDYSGYHYHLVSGQPNISSVKVTDTTRSNYLSFNISPSVNGITFSVGSMKECFKNCSYITSATSIPEIPNVITDLESCFENCTSLVVAPTIPSNIVNMTSCFSGCTSLETVSTIPYNVEYIDNCFNDCIKLTGEIEVYNTPKEYENIFQDTIKSITIIDNNETGYTWREIANQYSNVIYYAPIKLLMDFQNQNHTNGISIGINPHYGYNVYENFYIENKVRFNKNIYIYPDAELDNLLKSLK